MDAMIQLPATPQDLTLDPGWLERRDSLLAKAQDITAVADQDAYDDAEVILKRLTKTSNEMEKFRKDFSKPYQAATKMIKKLADDARDPLETEKSRLKVAMAAHVREVEAKRQAELERQAREAAEAESRRQAEIEAARKEAEQSDDPFAAQVAEQEAAVAPEVPQIVHDTPQVHRTMSSVVTVVKFEITNPNNVPRDFCIPDERKIRAAVMKGNVREIPGVRIWEDKEVRSR